MYHKYVMNIFIHIIIPSLPDLAEVGPILLIGCIDKNLYTYLCLLGLLFLFLLYVYLQKCINI